MPVMVDSCVYLDVFTRDPKWYQWSSRTLAKAASASNIVLSSVIYSEISVGFNRIEDLEALLPGDVFEFEPIPREAAFLAGKCFFRYRRSGGRKTTPLPDFFIGAHAAVANLNLITRNASRFRTYYPSVNLITP